MKQKFFQDLRERGSRLAKRNRKQKVLQKLSIPGHGEFDMILIDLSKSLHVGGGKTNGKETAVANDKVAIAL